MSRVGSGRVGAGLGTRAALICVAATFATNGFVLGAYAGSLPTLREHLGLNHPLQIPAVLLVVSLFGILGMQVGGRAAERVGPRLVTLSGFAPLGIGAIVFGISPTYPLTLVGGALLGFGNGLLDVSMNAFAVRVEQARRKAVMSRLHALWSLGNASGAGVVLGLGQVLTVGPGALLALALATTAVATLAAGVTVALWCPPVPPEMTEHLVTGGRVPRIVWVLGAMAVAFGLAEGTAYDWSAILITDIAGVTASVGALGLTVTASAMVTIRLLGDWLVDRFGRRAVVRSGGACAVVGFGLLIVGTALPVLLAGWGLVGLGIGAVAPQVYAVAGHQGGPRGLAMVVTFGYATFLAGPAVIGGLIGTVGIQPAMVAPGLLCLALVVLAQGMPRRD